MRYQGGCRAAPLPLDIRCSAKTLGIRRAKFSNGDTVVLITDHAPIIIIITSKPMLYLLKHDELMEL